MPTHSRLWLTPLLTLLLGAYIGCGGASSGITTPTDDAGDVAMAEDAASSDTTPDAGDDAETPSDVGEDADPQMDTAASDTAVEDDTATRDTAASDTETRDTAEADAPPGPIGACDPEASADPLTGLTEAFEAITDGVPDAPITRALGEDTNGELLLGFGGAFPIVSDEAGVYVAATTLGEGRVVAFSGQDFLSSGTRSTLIDDPGVRRLVQSAALWAAGGPSAAEVAAAVGSEAVATALAEVGVTQTAVAPIVRRQGLHEIRDWSAEALAGRQLAVVQVNEWGTLHLGDEHIEALRRFVMEGGGLLIAGSALHWSWWLADGGPFPGDAVLDGAGITWERSTTRDMRGARARLDASSVSDALWCDYVLGRPLAAEALGRVGPLFEPARAAGRLEELDAALQRLLDESPALPVARDNPEAQLAANAAASLGPHPWPAPHPWAATFPGATSAPPSEEARAASVNTMYKRAQPLGAYVAPGDVAVVTFDGAAVDTGLVLRVGDLFDDNRALEHIDTWRRPPHLIREFPVDRAEVRVANAFGGSLYLVVPDDYPDQTVTVTVRGALPQAVYTLPSGAQAGAWSVSPGDAGAPLAILQQPGKVRMVVSAQGAAEVEDPAATLLFWEGFYDHHVDLSQEPAPRRYASHWIFDPQVGWGYANATASRINFPRLSEGWALRTRTGDEDWWLFGHELGHQFQTPDWSGGDITEVAVNLWTMYTLNAYIHDGGDFETRGHQGNAIDHAALQSARWGTADLFGKLELYRQLVFVFGWGAFKQTFASYHDPAWPRAEYGGFMDGFALRFSAIVERDITPFLLHWEYPISQEAVDAIVARGHAPWSPPGW